MKRDKLYTYGKKGNIFWPGGELNSYGWMPEQMQPIASPVYKPLTIPTLSKYENFGASNIGSFQAPSFNSSLSGFSGLSDSTMRNVGSYYAKQTTGGGGSKGLTGSQILGLANGAVSGIGAAFQDDPQYSADAGNGFGLVDSFISQGTKTKGGTALVNTGASLMNTGLSSGNGALMLAGGIAGTLGTLWNAGWGVKENKHNVAAVKENIATARSAGNDLGNASTNEGVLNAAGNMTGSLGFSASDLYKNGWFTKKGTKKGNALNSQESAALAYQNNALMTGAGNADYNMDSGVMRNFAAFGGPLDSMGTIGLLGDMGDMPVLSYDLMTRDLTRKEKQAEAKDKMGGISPVNAFCKGGRMFHGGGCLPIMFSLGGDIQNHGADWSTGMTHINAGESHELNPNEGVQVGVDVEGTPNLVEEGETIYNDYVYSNRITLDDEAKKAFHIGKKRDITYADMSKKLEKEAAERPNDPISKAALKVQMQDLADHQERQKQEMEAERAREAFEALSPKEQTAVMQQVAQQEQMAQEQAMQQEALVAEQQGTVVPEEASVMQERGIPTADAMGAMASGQPVIGALGGEINRFDYGGALKWLKENHPNIPHIKAVAKALDKYMQGNKKEYYDYPDVGLFGGNQSSKVWRYDRAWRSMMPVGNMNHESHMDKWANSGLTKDQIFDLFYPGKERNYVQNKERYKNYVMPSERKGEAASVSKSASKPVYATSANGVHTRTIDGVIQYRGADGKYYYNENRALATRKQEVSKKEEREEVPAQKQETTAAKPVEVKSNTNTSKAKTQVVPKSNTTKASTNASDGINVGTYRQEGNQWNAYGLPGLQDYLNRAFVDYDTAEDADKQQIAQNIVDTLNGVQQSYWDNIVPTLGQERQQRSAGVGTHQTLYNDVTNNAGFKGIDPITGQIYDRTDEAIIMPEGHNTSDNLANGWVDEYSGPKTWLRYLGASGDDLDAIVNQLRSRGIDYSPYKDWTIGEGDNARQLYRASLINSPSTANEGFPEDATQFGDASNYTVDVNGEPDVDDFVEVDANGNPISSSTANRSVAPVLRSEWPRYVGLFGPAVGLGMQALGIGKPDTKAFDGVIDAYDKTGASFADYKPIGNYITYNPLDTWAGQNRLNANARATDRAIMNSGTTQGSKVAGLLANEYNNQIGSGNLFRQAQEYNDNLKKQVAEFNRGTDQFNAQAYNQLAQFNASQRDRDRQMRAQLGMQAAAQKADMDAGWYNGIYGNVAGLFKGISDLGRENAERNMLARLTASGALGTIKPESAINAGLLKYADEAAEGGKIKRKKNKRRGLTI